jgi:hypothetical protein
MPTPDELHTIAAAFLHVRVGELLPYLGAVTSNSSVSRTRYLARCPACDQPTFSFSQGKNGIAAMCKAGCPAQAIAAVIVERRLGAGEHPENVWGRADRALRGEE